MGEISFSSSAVSCGNKYHLLQCLHLQSQKTLSTHEKELKKLKSKIEQMEQENLEPKTWTMQGEVS